MPTPMVNNGNYDRLVEIGRELFARIAGSTLAVASSAAALTDGSFTATASTTVGLRDVWFKQRPNSWIHNSQFKVLPTERASDSLITLCLHVDVAVVFSSITVGSTTIHVESEEDKRRFSFNVKADVEVTSKLTVDSLSVRPTADSRSKTVPCAYLDLISEGKPEVLIDKEAFKRQALIGLYALAVDSTQPMRVIDALVDQLHTRLVDEIWNTLRRTTDFKIDRPGWVHLYSELSPPARQICAKVLPDSIVIAADFLSSRGDPAALRYSYLAEHQNLAVIVSCRYLLQDIIQPVLSETFGLSRDDFDSQEWSILRRPVEKIDLIDGRKGKLEYLGALVDGEEHLRIRAKLILAGEIPGQDVIADLDMKLRLTAEKAVDERGQVVSIKTELANPETAVASRTTLAWYYWVFASPFLAGPANGIFDLIARPLVKQAVAGIDSPSQEHPLPLAGVLRKVTSSLRSDYAPAMPTPTGAFLFTAFQAACHDLSITAEIGPLPQRLTVDFQIADSSDPGYRLDGVGGKLDDGEEWALLIDDAIALVDAGYELYAGRATDSARVLVAPPRGVGDARYLKTKTDDYGPNNLSNLPRLQRAKPPFIDRPVGRGRNQY